MYEMNYKDDMEQGNQKFFGINGELFLVLMYDKGDLIAWVRNSKQGTLTDTLRVTGAKQTIEANYKNGTLAFKDELEFGMENGTYMVYQNDGKVVYQSQVKNDKLEGERTISYPNGKLYSREFFIHGDLEGECNYYWENGNLMVTSNYKRDELHGTTKLYDINGKLKETRMYYDDELISIKKN
jgi:antitoxin component YwqK of YwqJK toxin-antitoxin module